jgi:hypothetical protein
LGGALVVVIALFAPRYSLIAFIAVVLLSVIVAPFFTRRALDAHRIDAKE